MENGSKQDIAEQRTDSAPKSADQRTELAEERTDWAEERTLLAKQRTFSAWVRTGLAAMAVGFGVTRLLEKVEPAWMITTIGVILIVTGAVIHILGFMSYRKTLQKLNREGIQGIPLWLIGLITFALILSAGIGVWLVVVNGA
jgi:putative membrane protein